MPDDEGPKRPEPKWLSDTTGNQQRARRSNKAERRDAKAIGGKRISGSGNRIWSSSRSKTDRGDISTPEFHVEHKRTERESLSIKRDWLEKVADGAEDVSKDPALLIAFERPHEPPYRWVMVPLEVAQRRWGMRGDDD